MNQELALLFEKLNTSLGLLVLSMVVLEWVILVVTHKIKSNKEGWVNMLSYVVESIPYVLLGRIIIFGTMVWLYQFRLFTLGTEWYIWIIAYVLYDFMFWLVHYMGHKVRFFWCIHGVHHTPQEMKLTVTVRGSFLGILHTPHTILWMPLLGFDPLLVINIEAIARVYALYEHVNENFDKLVGKQRWLECIFITPLLHRIHHARNHVYLDTNYGVTFSFWDKMFGTLQSEVPHVKTEYGIMDDKINSKNFLEVQFQLWKELWKDIKTAPRFLDKLKYIIMPPGWNHIDGGKLANEIRNEAWEKLYKKKLELPELKTVQLGMELTNK